MTPTLHRVCSSLGAAVLAMVLATPGAFADSIFIGTLERSNVNIRDIKDGLVHFSIEGRHAEPIDLSRITRLTVRDETAFNAAEEAFLKEDWDKASDGYRRTINATNKEWLKTWSAQRLVESAGKANRFDAAVTAYIQLVAGDPAVAARNKPVLPDAKSAYLNTAVAELNTAIAGARTDAQKQALLTFLLEIHRTRGDSKALNEVAQQIIGISADSNDPLIQRGMAELKLGLAKQALSEKKYDQALSEIESSKAIFNEPAQQAEALFCIAEAKYGQLADKDDPVQLKDVALDYMRVVAHFKDLPGRPHLAESLLKVADIHVRLNDKNTARELYQSVASQFKDQPPAEAAEKKLAELQ